MHESLPRFVRRGCTAAALIALMSTLALAAKPTSHIRAEIPAQYKWDLGPIFPNWDA